MIVQFCYTMNQKTNRLETVLYLEGNNMNSQEGLKDTFRNMRKQGSEPTMVTQSMENILAKTFRLRADRVYIPALKNSHPAFMFWLEKLKPNEKLPRGKFFKRYAFIKVHTKTGHCVSVEAASAGIK